VARVLHPFPPRLRSLGFAARSAAPLLLAGALTAQTFVVDASNGPGTHFTNLAAAVAAVPDGATLLVRAGAYQEFVADRKGLAIHGEPGATVVGRVTIQNTHSAQTTTFTGFTFVQPGNATYGIGIVDCIGLVVVERVQMPALTVPQPSLGFASFPASMTCQRSPRVILRASTVLLMAVSQSGAVIEDCTLRGCDGALASNNAVSFATPALFVGESRVQVAGATRILGGHAGSVSGGVPAVGMQVILSQVDLRDGRLASGPAGPIGNAAAAIASSSLRIDPRVVVQPSGAQTFFGTPSFVAMPALTSTSANPGGTMRAEVTTTAGDLVLLGVAFPAAPRVIPGLPTEVWLDPGTLTLQAAGLQPAGVPFAATVAVPATPGLVGTRLAWQAVTWNPTAGFTNSNPSIASVD
jgi:hypothetical protein